MREFAVPATVRIRPEANLADPVFENSALHEDDVSFVRKQFGTWRPVTAREFATDVRQVAAGLVAGGVEPGDRVALLSRTRYEWTVIDFAIWTAGAVTVPVYETSSAEQVAWNTGDSGAVAIFVETDDHKAMVESLRAQLPDLKCVFHIDGGDLDKLREYGVAISEADLESRRKTAKADSLATIIYTSGTTGRPKGCELTHGNMLSEVRAMRDTAAEVLNPEASTLLFLPLAHVFARMIQCSCVHARARMGHTADIKNLMSDFQAFQPTFILAVPRIFEKVYNTAKMKAQQAGRLTARIFDAAESTAIAYSEALERGHPGPLLRIRHALFDRLVYGKLREAMGGKTQYAVSGGGPLGARLGHFFRGIGLTILEGYGLTETTAGATLNLPRAIRVGTVGRPVAGTSLRIADDGEVLIKGPIVYRGYWHNDTDTREALDPDGWFHSGDIGKIDEDGYLAITGRKKELIVTAGGKNVAPAVLEDRIRADVLIDQAIVVGDGKPFIACLVTIDPDCFPTWKADHGKPASATVYDLRDDPDLRVAVQKAIDEANQAVSHAESIRKFAILPVDLTEEAGQITPTLKLKRGVIMEEFADAVQALYTP
ncbi:MAG: AMP-dependent synthetase/ligase [Mycobacteriaceae bacterium]